jgi:hypothetical protein
MSLRPRFSMMESCVCEPDGEFEGKVLQIKWLGWVIELTIAKWKSRDA